LTGRYRAPDGEPRRDIPTIRTGARSRDGDGEGDGESTVQLSGPPPAARGDDGYSATALDGSWTGTAPEPAPDTVLRFGPGVPSTQATAIWTGGATPAAGTPPAVPPSARRRPVWLRRYGLAAVVLAGVAAFLLWQRSGPPLEITAVSASAEVPQGCDATTEITAVVRTNGRPGTLTYQWNRSDGTSSGVLEERLARGQREARLTLLWTFHGQGTTDATAELRITTPSTHTASAAFTYTCP
jgi:hypothetical protein